MAQIRRGQNRDRRGPGHDHPCRHRLCPAAFSLPAVSVYPPVSGGWCTINPVR